MTKYLYRKLRLFVTLAAATAIFSSALQAQFRAPLPERKTPRAVAVLETFKNGSRRLVPVTFFYEHHYYDATFYHATPVPFVLYSQTVYEVQQFGKALATFTVLNATQNAAAWFGNGRYKAVPDEAAALASRKAPRPVVLEDPSKPMLHRRAGSEGGHPAAHPAAASTAPEADNDPNRPKLHRREGSNGDTSASAQAQNQTPQGTGQASAKADGPQAGSGQADESSEQDPDRPRLHRRDDSQAGKSAPSTGTGSLSTVAATPAEKAELTPDDDSDHPILRRGKPVQEQSGHDLTDFTKAPDFTKKEEPAVRQVAVSDASPSEAQQVIYVCPDEQRRQMEVSARELALAELRRIAAQRGLVLPAAAVAHAAPPKTRSQARQKAAPTALAELKLDDEQFVPYDLDYNDYATVVFSARYAPQEASAQSAPQSSMTAKGQSWVVTVVARQDGDKLIKLYSAVSNPRELDLYPEVRLVDAVDPDGYGRYGLLFREQKRDGVSWLLARATGYELQTVFETAER